LNLESPPVGAFFLIIPLPVIVPWGVGGYPQVKHGGLPPDKIMEGIKDDAGLDPRTKWV